MLLLTTPTPVTTADLVATLRSLLSQVITVNDQTFAAEGIFPNLAKLHIDVTRATPLPQSTVQFRENVGHEIASFTADDFSMIGAPFGSPDRPLDLRVSAKQVRATIMDVGQGQTALKLAGAAAGHLRASVAKKVLETAFLTEANKAAKAQGVEIRDIQTTFTTPDSRQLLADIVLKAKKGFLPAATIRIRGVVAVDSHLNAHLSGLSVDGEGIVGGVAASFIRPRLIALNNSRHSLLTLPLDDLRLTDVRVAASPQELIFEAEFAGA